MSVRQSIHFDEDVLRRLKSHLKERYGDRRAISIVVQYAIIKYLDGEEGVVSKAKATKPKRPTVHS